MFMGFLSSLNHFWLSYWVDINIRLLGEGSAAPKLGPDFDSKLHRHNMKSAREKKRAQLKTYGPRGSNVLSLFFVRTTFTRDL